jgi:hypothetical protein
VASRTALRDLEPDADLLLEDVAERPPVAFLEDAAAAFDDAGAVPFEARDPDAVDFFCVARFFEGPHVFMTATVPRACRARP